MMSRQQGTPNDLNEDRSAQAALYEPSVRASTSKSNELPMASTIESGYGSYGQNYNNKHDDNYVPPPSPYITPQVQVQNAGYGNYGGLQSEGTIPVAGYYGAPPQQISNKSQPHHFLIPVLIFLLVGVVNLLVFRNLTLGLIFLLMAVLFGCFGLVTCCTQKKEAVQQTNNNVGTTMQPYVPYNNAQIQPAQPQTIQQFQ